MHTTYPNGVVLEELTTNVALYERPAARHTGRIGSTETVYADVHRVVAHPFAAGHKVRIGKGKVEWTVEDSGPDHVSLRRVAQVKTGLIGANGPIVRSAYRYKVVQYDQLTRLTKIGA
jgi:hypothetical protein